MSPTARRWVALVLYAVALLCLGTPAIAGPAHSSLLSVVPADRSVLDRGPSEIVLTFNEDIAPSFAQVALTSEPAGAGAAPGVIATSPVAVTGRVARVTLTAPGPGAYRIAYRVVSADGHPISGETTFTVRGPLAPPTSTAPSSPGAGASSAGPASSSPVSASAPSTSAPGTAGGAAPEQGRGVLVAGFALLFLAAAVGLWQWRRRP